MVHFQTTCFYHPPILQWWKIPSQNPRSLRGDVWFPVSTLSLVLSIWSVLMEPNFPNLALVGAPTKQPSWGTFFFCWEHHPAGSHRKIKPKPDTGYFPIGSNGTGMFTYLWLSFMVNVGKIFRYMDPRIESWLLNRDPQNGLCIIIPI